MSMPMLTGSMSGDLGIGFRWFLHHSPFFPSDVLLLTGRDLMAIHPKVRAIERKPLVAYLLPNEHVMLIEEINIFWKGAHL